MRLDYYAFAPGSGGLSTEESETLVDRWDEAGSGEALVGYDTRTRTDPKRRRSQVHWFDGDGFPDWLTQRLTDVAAIANTEMWNFDLWGVQRSAQLIRYSDVGDQFDWHVDTGPGRQALRKIGIVIQLSNPNSYCGADLEFLNGEFTTTASRELGTVLLFPTPLLHRVSPLVSGCRFSLSTWILGPEFR